jgi:hypothetical protein
MPGITILATGPLTSDALSREIERITGSGHLAFYDSISPIVDAETIDMERVYFAARWDKGTADYINCPWTAPSTTASSTGCWLPKPPKPKSGRSWTTSKAACRLRCWRGAGGTRCASGR